MSPLLARQPEATPLCSGLLELHTLSTRRAVPGLCPPHGPWNGRHTQTLTATRAALCPSLQAASTSPGPVQDAGLCCHGPDTPRGCMQGAGMQMDTINKVFLIINYLLKSLQLSGGGRWVSFSREVSHTQASIWRRCMSRGGDVSRESASQNLYAVWRLGRCSPTPRRGRVTSYCPLLPPTRERLTVVGQGRPPGLSQALLLRLGISLGQAGCGEQGW